MNLTELIGALEETLQKELPGRPLLDVGCPDAEPIQVSDILEVLKKVKKCCDELNGLNKLP